MTWDEQKSNFENRPDIPAAEKLPAEEYNTLVSELKDRQTAEEVQDVVGALVSGGTNITTTYNDANDVLTVDTSALNEEQVEDAVSSLVTAGNAITVNYDDPNDSLSIAVNESALSFYDGTNLTAPVDNESVSTDRAAIGSSGTTYSVWKNGNGNVEVISDEGFSAEYADIKDVLHAVDSDASIGAEVAIQQDVYHTVGDITIDSNGLNVHMESAFHGKASLQNPNAGLYLKDNSGATHLLKINGRKNQLHHMFLYGNKGNGNNGVIGVDTAPDTALDLHASKMYATVFDGANFNFVGGAGSYSMIYSEYSNDAGIIMGAQRANAVGLLSWSDGGGMKISGSGVQATVVRVEGNSDTFGSLVLNDTVQVSNARVRNSDNGILINDPKAVSLNNVQVIDCRGTGTYPSAITVRSTQDTELVQISDFSVFTEDETTDFPEYGLEEILESGGTITNTQYSGTVSPGAVDTGKYNINGASTVNGLGYNAGDPNSTGVWNGNGYEGVRVRDTTNNNTYEYSDGGWSQIAST